MMTLKKHAFLNGIMVMFVAVFWSDCRAEPSHPAPGGGQPPVATETGCLPLSLAHVALPVGILGVPFSQTIQANGGKPPVTMMITSGAFPPGLTMTPAGAITGTPKATGTFTFIVTATDSCRIGKQSATRTFRLSVADSPAAVGVFQPSVVEKQPLKVTVAPTPAAFTIPAGKAAERQVSYRITAQPAQATVITSPGATFSVEGAVIESVPSPLSAAVINGSAEISETVTIPMRIMEKARREKAAKIVYSRAFSGRDTTALAVIEITLSPEAGNR